MSNVLSNQQVMATLSNSRERIRSVTLWIMQGVLALLFLFAGGSKLLLPTNVLQAQLALALPIWFLRFIGVIEVAGALGLILPQLTHIKPFLTPLAAWGLALEMVGATIVTVIAMGVAPALFPLIVGLLAVFVAYGRGQRWRSV
jgi:DoxX-like family